MTALRATVTAPNDPTRSLDRDHVLDLAAVRRAKHAAISLRSYYRRKVHRMVEQTELGESDYDTLEAFKFLPADGDGGKALAAMVREAGEWSYDREVMAAIRKFRERTLTRQK